VTTDGPGALPTGDLLAMLDADPQGWAIARSVREQGRIVDFELIYLNPVGGRILGRPPPDLIGRRYRELWPDTVNNGTLPLYRQVVESRAPLVRTVYYNTVSVAGHFELRIAPCGDGFMARFIDLTKLTVGPQSEKGARLYEVLDAAFDGFVLLRGVRDEPGQIVDFVCEYVNQVGAKLAGRTVEDVIGRRLSEISPSTMQSGLFDRCREVAESDTPWREQLEYPEIGQVWEIKVTRVDLGFVAVSYREVTEQFDQQAQIARSAAQAREAAERTAALQVVTAALVAASTSAEVYATMGSVVRPSAGGRGIAVLLRDENRLVLGYHDGYEPDVVEQLAALPLSHPYPATEVSTTGQPRYLSSPAEFTAMQPDPSIAISAGGRKAWAFLPLAAAGQVFGTLVIGYAEPRDFDEDEQSNLIAFSRLGAQALQRALLFEAQLSIAADLQRALLPAALPQLNGARHAVRYLPWTRGADVGGDWYDVIQLDPDAVAVVIGDVVGHSSKAAATMGQLRNALRAYAAEGHSPSGVMERVNHLLLRLEPDAVATCCYLELHLAEGTATAVLAGHPPPVLRAGGDARPLTLRGGPPLGVDERAVYIDSTFLLPTGSTLLLYTDGLVEDRRYDIDRGLAELCAAVRSAPTSEPEALVEHILNANVGPHPRSDDVAILALTLDGHLPPGPLVAERRFRSDAASAPAARRFAADILTAWRQRALVDDACLLLDEVITNAVQHTLGDVRVQIALGQRLRIEVRDRSDRHPDKRPVAADSEIGRGLHIVETLARAWGFEPLPGAGKVVWFELDRASTTDTFGRSS
jgi:serine phosphatase RsbU (regulator of sigma subunit)/PAS domain-containing protein